MKLLKICLAGCFLLAACNSEQGSAKQQELVATPLMTKDEKDYELVMIGDGIYVEKFDSTNADPERFNRNNSIYTVGTEFSYTYEYIQPEGGIYHFEINDSGWDFIPEDQATPTTVKEVSIDVRPGKDGSDYNQTIAGYSYRTNAYSTSSSTSGVIENETNVWLHPPRNYLFKILELSPFPFIQQPYEVGNQWQWELQIGQQWGDARWATWEGNITNRCSYQITEVVEVDTPVGILKCYLIKGDAESEIGLTQLTAYFNEEYGFVRLHYTNIDGSMLNMALRKINRKIAAEPSGKNNSWPGIFIMPKPNP